MSKFKLTYIDGPGSEKVIYLEDHDHPRPFYRAMEMWGNVKQNKIKGQQYPHSPKYIVETDLE